MKHTDAKHLLKKYRAGKCSPEEYALLESWYIQWNNDDESSFTEAELLQLQEEMWLDISKPVVKIVSLWKRIALAGAVAVTILGVWFFISPDHSSKPTSGSQYVNDVAPGRKGASITLANGKVIRLNEAKDGVIIKSHALVYSDGSNVNSAEGVKNAQMLVASTSKGQTYSFTLPDGSKVWLNAATSIKFPSTFAGADSRNIELGGEAYFEVAKDSKHPFVVKTAGQEITVLGTHFNVNAYQENQTTKTTLLEGAVHVVASAGGSVGEATLKPGQSAATQGANIRVDDVDTDEAIAWKEGYFTFNRETLESVMLQISRWYNVDISYEDERIKSIPFSGSITRFGNISEILNKVELTGKVRFKVEGRKVSVINH
jgi:transmembrane sensor